MSLRLVLGILVGLCVAGCNSGGDVPTECANGTLIIGHEVRAFTPDGDTTQYWLVDKTGNLMAKYQQAIGNGDIVKYAPVSAELKLQKIEQPVDGFGASYPGAYNVLEIVSVGKDPRP